MSVLDLACGKGSDFRKWTRQHIARYIGVDIAKKSLETAIDRLPKKKISCEVRFGHADLGIVDLHSDIVSVWTLEKGWHEDYLLRKKDMFDIVTMQFAFHYLFGERKRAERILQTLSDALKPGGIFLVTTTDPNTMVQHLMQTCGTANAQGEPDPIQIKDNKDRAICTIRFDPASRNKLLGYDPDDGYRYGLRYNFTLIDSEDAAVDAPEYLILNDLLEQLLESKDMKIILQMNFQNYIKENLSLPENKKLLEIMNVFDNSGSISDCEWAIAGLYQVIAIQKNG